MPFCPLVGIVGLSSRFPGAFPLHPLGGGLQVLPERILSKLFSEGWYHPVGWCVVLWAPVWLRIAILCGIWDPFTVLWVGFVRYVV